MLLAQSRKVQLPTELNEASGLHIASPDSLWWHNDSGGEPALYLTNAKGKLLLKIPVPHAVNRDWEDLCAAPDGRFFIGDFGNNANRRQDLRIYIFNPAHHTVDSILFRYPDQEAFPPPPAQASFDMEAMCWWNDTLHLFSKNRLQYGNYYTKHYLLPAHPGNYTALLADSVLLPKRVATAAAIRPDGRQLALLSYYYKRILGVFPHTRTSIWLWQDFPHSHFFSGQCTELKVRRCLRPTQYEAIDYIDAQTLIIASERVPLRKAHWYRVKLPVQPATSP